MTETIDTAITCERILKEGISYNNEHEILPSENIIAERLLKRQCEMKSAYSELHDKLGESPPALEVFLGRLLSAAAFWNPDKSKVAREMKAQIEGVNKEISENGKELAALLAKRSELENSSGFTSNTHFHVISIIEEAAADNHLFNSRVKDPLHTLACRFDLKYWPSPSKMLRTISQDADQAILQATDSLTDAFTVGKRSSRADFIRALLKAINEESFSYSGHFPKDFNLTDNTLATLANCALGLEPDEMIDCAYVKRLRQRERERNR